MALTQLHFYGLSVVILQHFLRYDSSYFGQKFNYYNYFSLLKRLQITDARGECAEQNERVNVSLLLDRSMDPELYIKFILKISSRAREKREIKNSQGLVARE